MEGVQNGGPDWKAWLAQLADNGGIFSALPPAEDDAGPELVAFLVGERPVPSKQRRKLVEFFMHNPEQLVTLLEATPREAEAAKILRRLKTEITSQVLGDRLGLALGWYLNFDEEKGLVTGNPTITRSGPDTGLEPLDLITGSEEVDPLHHPLSKPARRVLPGWPEHTPLALINQEVALENVPSDGFRRGFKKTILNFAE